MIADMGSLVGDPSSFDTGTIERLKRDRGIGHSAIIEKALWALEYSAQLNRTGLDYVLKGGTAVQLVTDPDWPRFSVDVDICTEATKEQLEAYLSVVSDRMGDGFDFKHRPSKRMSDDVFTSYRVRTPAILGEARTILLDAYLSIPSYTVRPTPLRSFFYDSSSSIITPTVGGLLGDKLTTIASGTVGRAINDSRQGVEYAKHVFDIHRLARSRPEPEQVQEAFRMVIDEQNRIRGSSYGTGAVVTDVVDTCKAMSTLAVRGDWEPTSVPDLPLPLDRLRHVFRRGVKDIRGFLTGNVTFGIDELVTATGEVALLAIATRSKEDMETAIDTLAMMGARGSPAEDSHRILDTADPADVWFIDQDAGLYSTKALAIWAEVILSSSR